MGNPIRENVCTQIPTEILLIFVNIQHFREKKKTPYCTCTKLINKRVTSIIRLSKKLKVWKLC